MLDNKNKLILFVVILIIAFIVITYLKNLNIKEQAKDNEQLIIPRPKTCEESCNNNQECMKSCYSIQLNKAIATKDINLCNEIPNQEFKQTCKDNINFNLAQLNKDVSKCDLISNNDVKQTCKGSLK